MDKMCMYVFPKVEDFSHDEYESMEELDEHYKTISKALEQTWNEYNALVACTPADLYPKDTFDTMNKIATDNINKCLKLATELFIIKRIKDCWEAKDKPFFKFDVPYLTKKDVEKAIEDSTNEVNYILSDVFTLCIATPTAVVFPPDDPIETMQKKLKAIRENFDSTVDTLCTAQTINEYWDTHEIY